MGARGTSPVTAYGLGMATLREAQKELTRRLLLEAALELFDEQGYAATTVDHIASRAGTTRVTFYAYFPSRSDLMRALINEKLNDALQRDHSQAGASTERELVDVVRDGTRERIAAWMQLTAGRWPQVRPILSAAREASVIDLELRTSVDAWMEEAIHDIQMGLELAGRFAPHSRHYRGALAMAQLDYTASHWPDADWGADRETVLQMLTESWLGLLSEPSPTAGSGG